MPAGGSWGPDDTIVFPGRYADGDDSLYMVSAFGGEAPARLTTPDAEGSHWAPDILPSGSEVLFAIRSPQPERSRIAVLSLESREYFTIIEDGTRPRYVPTGHILYFVGDTLTAVPFDSDRLEVTGGPVSLLTGVQTVDRTGFAAFAMSNTGSAVFSRGTLGVFDEQLVWVDRAGTTTPVLEERAGYRGPRVSPDGSRLAFQRFDRNGRDISVLDIERGARWRLTPLGMYPLWSPDSREVAFSLGNPLTIYAKAADGSGDQRKLLQRTGDLGAGAWAADGETLVYWERYRGGADGRGQLDQMRNIGLWPGHGDVVEILATRANERAPSLSPNGRWLAYVSDESGQDEVYAQPFPGPGPRELLSSDGGTEPVWSPRGDELFYRPLGGDGLMSVALRTDAGRLMPDAPVLLFAGRFVLDDVAMAFPKYDVAPDGERFVMVQNASESGPGTGLSVILNLDREIIERAPAQ